MGIFSTLILLAWGCGDSKDKEPIIGMDEDFLEGQILMDVEMVNNPFYPLYQSLDLEEGAIGEQLENLVAGLNPEQKQDLEDFMDEVGSDNSGNLGYVFSMMFHAIEGKEILVQNSTWATTRYNTLQYHGEISYDTDSKQGIVYMESHEDSEKNLNFSYAETLYLEGGPQSVLSLDQFERIEGSESELVAGYRCEKVTYTLKNQGSGSQAFLKVEVWKSPLIPRSVNFVMPYLVDEQEGILKMVINHLSNENYPIVYQASKIEARQVLDSEMQTQSSSIQLEYPKDEWEISTKIWEILFQESE